MSPLSRAIGWIFGSFIAYAIRWAYSGQSDLGFFFCMVFAGLFVHFAAWVFKNVEDDSAVARKDDSSHCETVSDRLTES